MKAQTLVIVLFLVSASTANGSEVNVTEKISLRVQKALIQKFPWQLSLRKISTMQHICEASLIRENRALTASDCFNRPAKPRRYAVLGGSNELENNTIKFYSPVDRIVLPRAEHTDEATNNNLAVLWLTNAAPIGALVRPISLPVSVQSQIIPYGATAVVSGWGIPQNTLSLQHSSAILQYVSLPVISSTQCQTLYAAPLVQNNICTGFFKSGFCLTYSGGPLVYNGYQIGVLNNRGCDTTKGIILFTGVAPHVDWIHAVI